MYKITSIKNIESLVGFESTWRRLFDTSKEKNFFVSYEWVYEWLSSGVFKGLFRIDIVWFNDECILIAPMKESTYLYFFKKLSFLNDPMMADYSDFLFADNSKYVDSLSFLLDYYKSKYKKIELERIKGTSLAYDFFSRSKDLNLAVCECPYISLDGGWDEYLKSRPKKLRQELRTTRNKLNKNFEGKWSFSSFSISKDDYEKLVLLHLERQKFKVGSSIFSKKENVTFFSNLINRYGAEKKVDLSSLSVNDEIVSICLSLNFFGTYYYWIPTFNEKFKGYSLGKLHQAYLIEKAFEDSSCTAFDFMIGNESYKLKWATGISNCYKIMSYELPFLKSLEIFRLQIRKKLKDIKNSNKLLSNLWREFSKKLGY